MLIFPSSLIPAAKEVGMKYPKSDIDTGPYDFLQFPHFRVYCNMQLCRPMVWGEHWGNAKIIAAIPEDKIRTITIDEIRALGFQMPGGD